MYFTAYAATYRQSKGGGWNEAILQVVDGRDGKGGSWLPADMQANFEALQEGRCPDIDGVSGDWTFDPTTHAYVKGSTFRRWRLYDHRFLTMEYVSTEGIKHSSSSKDIISLRDLYYVLARNTTGSHVKVYNMDCFGSVYDNTMAEFLK